MYDIGAGEGLRPFEPSTDRGELPLVPPSRCIGEAFDHNGENSAL